MSGFNRLLALLAFGIAVAFLPGIPGAAIAPRWAMMGIGASALLLWTRWRHDTRIVMTPAHWLGLFLVLVALASTAWAPVPVEAIDALAKFVIVAMVFCLGAQATDIRPAIIAAALGITVSAVIAVFQVNGIPIVDQLERPGGLFANKNMMGELAALALVGSVASRVWWVTPGPLVAVILSSCYGAALGLAAAGLVWLWRWSWRTAAILGLLLLLSAHVLFVAGAPPAADFRAACTKQHVCNKVLIRGMIWMDAIENMTWHGHGIGQYWVTTPRHAPRQQELNIRHWHAHNDLLELAYELGIFGLAAVLLVCYCLGAPHDPARLMLITFLGMGLVGFPLHMPATAFLGALAAGHLAAARHRARKPVDYRPDDLFLRDAECIAVSDPCLEAAGRRTPVPVG